MKEFMIKNFGWILICSIFILVFMDKIEKIIKDKKHSFIIKIVIWTFIGSMVLYVAIMGITLKLGKSISFGESLSYFGSVLAACVTVFGVMWQIQKNNDKIDEEKENLELLTKLSALKYFLHYLIVNKNHMYIDKKVEKLNNYFKRFLESRISLSREFIQWIYCFDQEFFSKNLGVIMDFSFGKELLMLNDELLEFSNSFSYGHNIFKTREIILKLDNISNNYKISDETRVLLRIIAFEVSIIAEKFYLNHSTESSVTNLYFEVRKSKFQLKFNWEEYQKLIKKIESISLESEEGIILDLYIEKLSFLYDFIVKSSIEISNEEYHNVIEINDLLLNINKEINFSKAVKNRCSHLIISINDLIEMIVKEIQELTKSNDVEGIEFIKKTN